MFSFKGLRRIQELELSRRRVFVRADLNCRCTPSGQLLDDSKVVTLAQTVRHLQDQEARIVIGAHRDLSGPASKDKSAFSLEPVAARLAELLQIEVYIPEEVSGPMARKLIADLGEGRVVMLENLAFFQGELDNDEGFARGLAEGVDVYVGDCLTSPGNYASLRTLPKFCHQRAMGLGLESELTAVNRLLRQSVGRSVFLLGENFEQQRPLLHKLLSSKVIICAGGRLAATLLAAGGTKLGSTRFEPALLAEARTWLSQAQAKGVKVLLPIDARVCAPGEGGRTRELSIERLAAQDRVVDVGPKTEALYADSLSLATTIAMLAPLGEEGYDRGTRCLLNAVTQSNGFTVVCQPALHTAMSDLNEEQLSRLGFLSTAGQGFVDALCGHFLPTVEALRAG